MIARPSVPIVIEFQSPTPPFVTAEAVVDVEQDVLEQ
jgi:hypothetical protein